MIPENNYKIMQLLITKSMSQIYNKLIIKIEVLSKDLLYKLFKVACFSMNDKNQDQYRNK